MSEIWFKLVFVGGFATAVAVATTTARRATRRHGGSLNQLSHEIRGLVFVRAALGVVFYGTLIAWLFFPGALAWTYFPIPVAMRWLAAALLVPALVFFSWSFRSLGAQYRGGVGLHDAHELVTNGPYLWIRHPIYLSFIAIMLLLLPLTANWALGGSGLLLVLSITAARVPVEERELRERFGTAWERYRVRTGRWVPRFRREPR